MRSSLRVLKLSDLKEKTMPKYIVVRIKEEG
jgi:hypothetical protein